MEAYLHSAGWGSMAYVHFQNAGALKIVSQTLIVSDCYFFNNSNLKGGAIYFSKNDNYDKQYFNIEKCMNEKAPHINWAKKILSLAEIYGIRE